jgi:hypothetical protein
MSPQKKLVTWQLHVQFAAGPSAMHAAIGRDIHNPYALYAALSKEAPR